MVNLHFGTFFEDENIEREFKSKVKPKKQTIMKKNEAKKVIAQFGETVYNENGKAVFAAKSINDIDLDNDDEVHELISDLEKFNEALAVFGFSIEKEIKDGHYLTDMPFDKFGQYK